MDTLMKKKGNARDPPNDRTIRKSYFHPLHAKESIFSYENFSKFLSEV